VTGASGEGGILGSAAEQVPQAYMVLTLHTELRILGYDSYGVFGYSLGDGQDIFRVMQE